MSWAPYTLNNPEDRLSRAVESEHGLSGVEDAKKKGEEPRDLTPLALG